MGKLSVALDGSVTAGQPVNERFTGSWLKWTPVVIEKDSPHSS